MDKPFLMSTIMKICVPEVIKNNPYIAPHYSKANEFSFTSEELIRQLFDSQMYLRSGNESK